MRVVLPAEGDLTVSKSLQPVIGDGNAMRVASQIMQHVLRTAERRLRVHHPVLTEQRAKERAECRLFRKRLKSAGEAQLSFAESFLQPGGELPAKDAAEYLYRQEEPIAWANPALMIEGKTACWNHTMDMRMVQDSLPPTVKHAHETDLSTEVLGIRGYFQQRCGASPKQKIVDNSLIGQSRVPALLKGVCHNGHSLMPRPRLVAG